MKHNLNDTKKYPLHHKWLTAGNINIYTQGIRISQGDEIVYHDKTYIVEKAKEENIIKSDDLSMRAEYNNPERRYVNSKTKFYVVKLEGQDSIFRMIPNRDSNTAPILTEYRIPKYK